MKLMKLMILIENEFKFKLQDTQTRTRTRNDIADIYDINDKTSFDKPGGGGAP